MKKQGTATLQKIIEQQVNAEKKYAMNRGRAMTRHKSLYLAQTRYKCAHCGLVIQDVANLAQGNNNLHGHQCYATPYDKEMGKLTAQMLPVNARSSSCQFKHNGPCLTVYIERNKNNKQQNGRSAADKRAMLKKTKNWGTTDEILIGSNNSTSNLRDIEFDSLLYSNSLIDSKLTNIIDSGDDITIKQIGRNLQNWHKKQNSASSNKKNKNGKESNDFKLLDKSFWGEIFSSESSETEDEGGIASAYYNGGQKKRKKEVKDQNMVINQINYKELMVKLNNENKEDVVMVVVMLKMDQNQLI